MCELFSQGLHLNHCSILRLVLLDMISGLAVIIYLLSMRRIILSCVHSFLSQMKISLQYSQFFCTLGMYVFGWKTVKLAKLTYVIIGITKFLCALNNLGALVLNCGLKGFLKIQFDLEV